MSLKAVIDIIWGLMWLGLLLNLIFNPRVRR